MLFRREGLARDTGPPPAAAPPHMSPNELSRSQRVTDRLGITVDPSMGTGPAGDRALVEHLRRAHANGITRFDLAAARSPGRAVSLLRTAFPAPSPEITVLLGRTEREPAPAAPAGRSTPSLARTPVVPVVPGALRSVRDSLPPQARVLLEVPPWSTGTTGIPERVAALHRRVTDHELDGWSLRATREQDLPPAEVGSEPVPHFSIELSLLEGARAASISASVDGRSVSVFVRNPFASGRLDGSRIAEGLSDRRPRAGPTRLPELQAEFAPVLALGFLTEHRGRTLAQAAVQYLLTKPWVETVFLPALPPERQAQFLDLDRLRPLTPEEIDRIESGAVAPGDTDPF